MAQLTAATDQLTTTRNLTTLGTTFWRNQRSTVTEDTKNSGSGIGAPSQVVVSAFTTLGYNNDPATATQSDGTPTGSSTNTDGWYTGNTGTVGNGFQWVCTADTSVRTIGFYLGLFSSSGTFSATLSDGSATLSPITFPATGFNTASDCNVVLTVQAGSGGQTVTVQWVITTISAAFGNCTTRAQTLSIAAGGLTSWAPDQAVAEARRARRERDARFEALPPLGRAFVAMAVPIDRAPVRRIAPASNDVLPALATTAASSPAPDLAIGPPRARPLALVPQGDPIPPVVSRTIEATTATAAPRPIAPRQGVSDPTPPSALFLLTGGFDTASSDPRTRGRSSDASQSPLPPTPAGWTPDTGVAAPPTARPPRALQSEASPPSALFRLLGGFEFTPATSAARPRIVFALDVLLPPPFLGWAPPAPEALPRARPRAVPDAVLGLPIPITTAALTAWAPDLATGQRGWRRASAIPYGGEPLPALIATAQVTAWGYEMPAPPARGARRPAGAATDPIGPLILAWGFDMPPIVWRSARPVGAPPADPIAAALIAAWGWELIAGARPPRPRSLPSPDLALVSATPPIVVPSAEAGRRRTWGAPPPPAVPLPPFVAPVIAPWGYETVEAARRPRMVRTVADAVVARLLHFAVDPVGRGPSRADAPAAGPNRTSGSGGRTRSGGS